MIAASPQALADYPLVPHAWQPSLLRSIAPVLAEQVLRYSRVINVRGLRFRVLGHLEVDFFAVRGINLQAAEGIQVLVQPDGSALTTYLNHDLCSVRPFNRRLAMHR